VSKTSWQRGECLASRNPPLLLVAVVWNYPWKVAHDDSSSTVQAPDGNKYEISSDLLKIEPTTVTEHSESTNCQQDVVFAPRISLTRLSARVHSQRHRAIVRYRPYPLLVARAQLLGS
jgi:hypothetical protein